MQLSRTDLKIYSSLKRKSKREEHGLFIAEGVKVCQELINSDFSIKGLFCNHENADIFKEATIISEKDAQRISNQKNNLDRKFNSYSILFFSLLPRNFK